MATATVAKPTKHAIAVTCERVVDILADGPDSDADPVGYALAQVLPLKQVKTTDAALNNDIANVALAYETVYTTNDSKNAERAMTNAGKKLDAICPGAF